VYFSYFAPPPSEVGQNFDPPLEKTKMMSLAYSIFASQGATFELFIS